MKFSDFLIKHVAFIPSDISDAGKMIRKSIEICDNTFHTDDFNAYITGELVFDVKNKNCAGFFDFYHAMHSFYILL